MSFTRKLDIIDLDSIKETVTDYITNRISKLNRNLFVLINNLLYGLAMSLLLLRLFGLI
jgi:hypothetical protein